MSEIETKIKQKYYEPENFKTQFNEVLTEYSKFLFLPAKKDEKLKKRDFLFNRLKSKRKFATKLNNTLTKIGISAIFVVICWAIFAPWLARYNYNLVKGVDYGPNWYDPPSASHPFGVSKFGRDVLSRMIWGARSSLSIGLIAILILAPCSFHLPSLFEALTWKVYSPSNRLLYSFMFLLVQSDQLSS